MNNSPTHASTTGQQAPHLLLGRNGEELAATWLMRNGFSILDRNWKSKYGGELDIVAFRDNLIHVVEVKTRTSDFYEPMASIDKKKLMRLSKGAAMYKRYHRLNYEIVIDAIRIVYHDEQHYDLKFIPNVHLIMYSRDFYRSRRENPYSES